MFILGFIYNIPQCIWDKKLWSRGYTPWKGVSFRRSSQAARQIQRLATTHPTTLTDKDHSNGTKKIRVSTNACHHSASSTYPLSLIVQGVGEWVAWFGQSWERITNNNVHGATKAQHWATIVPENHNRTSWFQSACLHNRTSPRVRSRTKKLCLLLFMRV
jgi:hypothetical protein